MIAHLDSLDLGPVQWQGIQEYTTQRGKAKAILVGIPGPVFWKHWKTRDGAFKAKLREAMLAPQRIAKGQWQLVLWLNERNRHLAESLGYAVPVLQSEPSSDAPF